MNEKGNNMSKKEAIRQIIAALRAHDIKKQEQGYLSVYARRPIIHESLIQLGFSGLSPNRVEIGTRIKHGN